MVRDGRVLVTGASGLVGGHLVERLLEFGRDVVALVRDWEPASFLTSQLPRVAVVRGDVTDLPQMERVLGEHEVSTVYHLAAQTIVSIANRNPWSSWESNIRGTYTLMEAVRRSPTVEKVVVASTDKVYGQSAVLPTPETAALMAQFPYEVSKACADMVCRSYHTTYGTPVVLTRCGNLFGEGDLNFNRLVPGTISSILRNESPIIRSDGSLVRDYLYVKDVVDAYRLLADKGVDGEAYNISDGAVMDVTAMTRTVMNACRGSKEETLAIIHLNESVKEIGSQYLDSSKIRALDWKPRFGLDKGLERTVKWYRKHFLGKAIAETGM